MQTGALIAAAGKTSEMTAFRPLLKLNGTTLIQKEIDTLRRAGISPIVVITGYDAEALEHHLAHRGVICIRNEAYATTEMLDSVKMGLRYLKNRCEDIVFLPADAPLFSLESLTRVQEAAGDVVIPYHQGRSGHPIRISRKLISYILQYEGENGLRGALAAAEDVTTRVEVQDPGILMEVSDEESYHQMLDYEKQSLAGKKMTCDVRLVLGRVSHFFGPDTAGFLECIDEKGSMLAACKAMGMSYSKGWKMVKEAEENMGFAFLEKKAGGASGGNSRLTERGRSFLERYRKLQTDVERSTNAFFRLYFGNEE